MPTVDFVEKAKFLTPAELAERWRWHEESVRRWARQRKLDTVRVGRRVLFPLDAVEAVEAEGRIRRVA